MPTKKTFPPVITHPNSAFSKLHRVREETGHLVITLKGFTPQATSKDSETCLVCSIAFLWLPSSWLRPRTCQLPFLRARGVCPPKLQTRGENKPEKKRNLQHPTGLLPPDPQRFGPQLPVTVQAKARLPHCGSNTPRADLSGFPTPLALPAAGRTGRGAGTR